MTPPQRILVAANGVYLIALVATIYFTRATARRIAGALMGGIAVGVVGVGIEALAHTLGWWRYPFVETAYGPPLMYPVVVLLFAALALIGWRITRRFGARGQTAFLIAVTLLGTVRDYRVAAWLPEFIVFAPGVVTVLIDAACWGGLLAFAQAVMRLVAGPVKGDPLARTAKATAIDAGDVRNASMDEELEKRVRFLRAAHTDGMPHTEHRLLDHLLGTRRLLMDWRARSAVCDAGLFHSVYGTEHYAPTAVPISMRAGVQHLIGAEAESLAWLFCMMRRETFGQNGGRPGEFTVQHRLTSEWIPLTPEQFHDLVTMTFANTLEAFPRLSWSVRRSCRAYLRPFRGLAIAGAQDAFDRFDTHWWKFWQ